ncbi:lamina-associated polypeptide 2, isoforms alpha/zeta-like [Ranitomeya variabilis]|uniref:lamina-associated polypeptide 2, isoforms alpha/zeta-like n=1 Tax=Ranitomeya variabilis TaxID=490064 RepID=UPI004056EDAA
MEDSDPQELQPGQQRRTKSTRSGSSSRSTRRSRSATKTDTPSQAPSLTGPPPPEPGKKSLEKRKNRVCPTCDKALPVTWEKKLCKSCIQSLLCEETPDFASELKNVIRSEVQNALLSSKKEVKRVKESVHSHSARLSSENADSDDSKSPLSSSEEESGRHCFPLEEVDSLVRAVRATMGVEEPKPDKTAQDVMFGGLGQKKRRTFPLNPNVQTLIKREWEKPDRRNSSVPSLKRKYPFEDEASSFWDKAPKLDVAVAKASKKFALPFEDMGTLKDPLDKKADTFLKGAWESAGGSLRPAVAATCTSRSLMVWIDQLESQIKDGLPRKQLLDSFPAMRAAAAFLADSSADSVRLTSKAAALSNAARRTLWLKSWPGDLQTKLKLCSIPSTKRPSAPQEKRPSFKLAYS